MVRSISKNRIIRNVFTKLAVLYDYLEPSMLLHNGDQWRKRAIVASRLTRPHRLLDGCAGTGSMALQLAQTFGPPTHIVAVDFCPAMINMAKQKFKDVHLHRRVEFKTENVEIMPFPDEFFDAIFLTFGLRFVSDIKTVLRECRRVLKSGGPFIILEFAQPANPLLRAWNRWYREYLFPGWAWLRTRAPGSLVHPLFDSLTYYPDPDKLGRMLIRAGFDEVNYEKLGLGAVTLHRAIKPGELEV